MICDRAGLAWHPQQQSTRPGIPRRRPAPPSPARRRPAPLGVPLCRPALIGVARDSRPPTLVFGSAPPRSERTRNRDARPRNGRPTMMRTHVVAAWARVSAIAWMNPHRTITCDPIHVARAGTSQYPELSATPRSSAEPRPPPTFTTLWVPQAPGAPISRPGDDQRTRTVMNQRDTRRILETHWCPDPRESPYIRPSRTPTPPTRHPS